MMASSGMTFSFVPACRTPIVTTAESVGATSRETIVCSFTLPFAVLLIGLYIIVLASATMVEKWDGPEAAHFTVYGTRWFEAIHWALAVNVLCAMFFPLPWRWRQAGFLLTHVGILVLLAGCLATKYKGVEGQLPISRAMPIRMSRPSRSLSISAFK